MNRLSKQSSAAIRRIVFGATLAAADAASGSASALAQTTLDLAHLSIEALGEVEITSVSKRSQPLSEAAAAVYVITHEDIRRSGATSIAEILRLAPNLQVARIDASQYAISARGFNSSTANKLLVLIDGRSVYTPLYSGVFWDVQDVLPDNIERIEVISGPGGTLWGSNAVNGVLNIITRNAQDTLGTLVSAGAGNDERNLAVRHGGQLGENASYRLTARGLARQNTFTASGANQHDEWDKKELQLRVDWDHAGDTLMLSARAYDGSLDQQILDDKTISGGHLLGRWSRQLADDASVQVQTYYDRTKRVYPGTFGEVLDTYDLDVQHRFPLGTRHDIVWGGGYRLSRDDVTNSAVLAFLPAQRDLTLANIFVQDSIALDEKLQLTLGGKLEHNSYTGLEFQPNVRLAWSLPEHALLWSAISRAVRTPSRLDSDFFVPGASPHSILAGGPNFQSEKLTAYEIGYRIQPIANASFSISTFYNVYDKLRSVESGAGPGGLPLTLSNKLAGDTWGVEMWGDYRVSAWWRLRAGYNYLQQNLHVRSDSLDTTSLKSQADPAHQFSVRSTMDLMHNLELDVAMRAIGALPSPAVPGYVALDANLGWIVSQQLSISLSATNLLDQRHPEFGDPLTRSEIERSFFLNMQWKY
jgi:iron complex outermembrane receptor protein